LDERARRLIASFWPGPLTLVLRRRPGVVLHLGGDETTVGLRCPGQPIARRLLERTGPLAVTSANRHGEPPATTAEALAAVLGDAVAVVVDGGTCGGAPSSVLSLVGPEPVLLREGALSPADLESVWSAAPPRQGG
ncbi:MAG TPA: L-threonylcarbamoyladenylate synthase, partial [Acidimicrobiales bacterium]|nr:L-threonylcarbamoyladenylate synthase [Acidimicrobiales bacterium]